GFDGIELSKFYNPKLTTIVQPQKLIAEKSAELMISSIEGKISVPQRMVVDVTLFEGESVATRSEK
ncbi:MAG: substrate-binding domain-containing protein, partial [Oscillospiraceae bacterium]